MQKYGVSNGTTLKELAKLSLSRGSDETTSVLAQATICLSEFIFVNVVHAGMD